MADKLLVRMYDVGLGDCIYCRIPKAHTDGRDFHILIDCGSLSGSDGLVTAVNALKEELPTIKGKRHVDLLVVTHEHKDHMTGFGLKIWDDYSFGAMWMSAAMDLNHPEAEKAQKLHAFATEALSTALAVNLAMSPELHELAQAAAGNADAMKALRVDLPKTSGIKPTYVHAKSTTAELALPLKDGVKLSVLGPEKDIDYYYLGKDGDPSLRTMMGVIDTGAAKLLKGADGTGPVPTNLDPADFRALKGRMLSSALAFADLDGAVCNNTSVVLLIEWKKKRLLFVGDAEWDAAFKDGAMNSSWNTMWNKHKAALGAPLAFLKVGHHGSVNATPWSEPGSKGSEPAAILDAILPVSGKAKAVAIVSTRRANYATIPRTELLVELGQRISNAKAYAAAFKTAGLKTSAVPKFGEYEAGSFAAPQPPRTDLERLLHDQGYIEAEIG